VGRSVLYFAQRMLQALSRFSSFLRRKFLCTPADLHKRLGLISAAFGTGAITWLVPLLVRAQADPNAATAASDATAGISNAAANFTQSGVGIGAMAFGSYIFNLVGTIFATLLYLVIYALIFVNTLITDLVIRVAQYNNFVNAEPVRLGWPLVRDVCNMFFIVILLVIAFSTIIGYSEFHYKKNLPRLLLFAVLINFSRTLIGLMIDFSQVVMLTFVVGFKDAAFGNFAKAFQVPSLLSLSVGDTTYSAGGAGTGMINNAAAGVGAGLPTTSNIIIALLFGIWIMTIAMTALVILLIYFIARIVGLWVLLILSPLAFFVMGIPNKLGGAISGMGQYWKQLSAWLTGGPIVAFFLWLALAVLQSSNSPFADVGGTGRNAQEEAAVQAVITDIGKPENVLNFIVSVAFMLFGVKTAVEVSSSANPYLGSLAKKVDSGGGPAWQAVRGAPRAYRAAKEGTIQVASRLPGSKLAAETLNKRGGVGSGFGTAILSAQGMRQQEQRTAAAKGLDTSLKGLSDEQAINALRSTSKLGYMDRLRNTAARSKLNIGGAIDPAENMAANAAKEKLALLAVSKNGGKVLGKEAEKDFKGATADEKNVAKMLHIKREQSKYLDDAETMAKETGNDKLLDEIKAARDKDPGLMSYKSMAKSMSGDTKAISADAWGDFAVFMAYAKEKDLVDETTGGLVAGYKDDAAWKAISSGTGNAAKYVRNHAATLDTADGKTRGLSVLGALQDGASKAQIEAADSNRYLSRMSDDNTEVVTQGWNTDLTKTFNYGSTNTADVEGRQRKVKDVADLTRNLPAAMQTNVKTALGANAATLVGGFRGSATPDQATAVINAGSLISEAAKPEATRAFTPVHQAQLYNAMAAGVPPAGLGLVDSSGNIEPKAAAALQVAITKAFADADSANIGERLAAAQVFSNIDVKMLRQGSSAAQAVVDTIRVQLTAPDGIDKFKSMYNSGSGKMQKSAETVIREIVRTAESGRDKTSGRTPYENSAIQAQEAVLALTGTANKEIKQMWRGKRAKGGGGGGGTP